MLESCFMVKINDYSVICSRASHLMRSVSAFVIASCTIETKFNLASRSVTVVRSILRVSRSRFVEAWFLDILIYSMRKDETIGEGFRINLLEEQEDIW